MSAQHGARYTIAHAVLRNLLGRYCQVHPASLNFTSGAGGKPQLHLPGSDACPIRFNLTHSEDRALVGVGTRAEVGIDLERQRTDIEALAIGRHYFYGAERDALELAGPEGRIELFFRYWVAKEAVLKAQGVGLGLPLDRFRVDFLAGGMAARVTSLDPARLANDWTVKMLPCEPGWAAAVASRGTDWDVRLAVPDSEAGVVTDWTRL
ncbi:MAG TPA: 4'-phosphopantetheinyl transferase superfamily protein [Steroidobacteraceae bacterium]|nr:4'-phosphopantetheinyl transferase superfamily protein [Steroidobacteraceae bacterium]